MKRLFGWILFEIACLLTLIFLAAVFCFESVRHLSTAARKLSNMTKRAAAEITESSENTDALQAMRTAVQKESSLRKLAWTQLFETACFPSTMLPVVKASEIDCSHKLALNKFESCIRRGISLWKVRAFLEPQTTEEYFNKI